MSKSKKHKESEKSKANHYDRILKENAELIFIPLIERKLNFKISSYKALQVKISRTLEAVLKYVLRIFIVDIFIRCSFF